MAEMTIFIPNDKVSALVDAFANRYRYQTTVEATVSGVETIIPNPESKTAFAKRQIREHIKNVYVADQVNIAKSALNTTRTDALSTMTDIDVT